MKSQYIEMLPDFFGQGLFYGLPFDAKSLGLVFETNTPSHIKLLMSIAGFQVLALYLFRVFQRGEFSAKQWRCFLLFGLPGAFLSLQIPAASGEPRSLAWMWLLNGAFLFMGFRQHMNMPISGDLKASCEQATEMEKAGRFCLVRKTLIASILAMPSLWVTGLSYGASVMVLLCIFRVYTRRAWIIGLVISSPSLLSALIFPSDEMNRISRLAFDQVMGVYLFTAFLAYAGLVICERIFLLGKERQLAFAQCVPAMFVLAYTAHFDKRHVYTGLPVYGTEAKLILWGNESKTNEARDEMLSIYEDIDFALSLYKEDSELIRIMIRHGKNR